MFGGALQLVRRYRIPALFCALAVLLCALISRPYAEMGISDDGAYILMARHLAATGHIAYNGWAAPMLGWQLYLGAAFIKLFGFSYTAVRMSTLLVAISTAWLLQRTLVLTGITERNATIGTLALVLSPLYFMLSVTYMNDIFGLFAVVLCLYGCLRALQASTDRSTIAWLCFAALTNAVCGTSRQIAWLGILVMVPSTLWLLRARRLNPDRVLLAGSAATLASASFIFACMHWLAQQPYTIPEHLIVHRGEEFNILSSFFHTSLELPLLLLPVVLLFLPKVRRNIRCSIQVAAVASLACILIPLALHHWRPTLSNPLLEPYLGDWITRYGGYSTVDIAGKLPVFLHTGMRVVLTVASLGGLLGLIVFLLHPSKVSSGTDNTLYPGWRQLGILLAPFATVYTLILIPRAAAFGIIDRYLLPLLVVALLCLVRYYQERIQPRLPFAAILMVAITAIYSMTIVHNMFAFYRARVDLATELRADGVPDTSISYGWEYDHETELQHANHLNDPRIRVPAGAYVPVVQPSSGICRIPWFYEVPHIHPLYRASFDPNACYGPAPFAPVHYSRWPSRTPGTLYVVRYLPPAVLTEGIKGDPRGLKAR